MRKIAVNCIVVVFIMMFFDVSVYADVRDVSNIDLITNDVLEYFEWNEEDLTSYVNYHEAYVYSGKIYSMYDIELSNRIANVDVGSFSITSGFLRDRLSTFSDYRKLIGNGEEDTIIGAYVFHYETVLNHEGETETVLVPTQDLLLEIGRSGLYNETIDIDYIGDNYVLIAVDGDEPEFKLFKVVRKKVETKQLLENIQIDFFDNKVVKENPSIEEYVPSIFNFGF